MARKHAKRDFDSDNSLKQQSVCGHISPLWHIILVPSKSVFGPTR